MPDRSHRKQAARRAAFLFGLLILVALAPALAACGKKAAELEPPGGKAAAHEYPRVYPDPATDPGS